MHTQGFEWDVVEDIISTSLEEKAKTGADILPIQLALEMHYLTQFPQVSFHGRDLSPGEIFMYFQDIFVRGGYILAERRDNDQCPHCSEILLVRAKC